MKRISLITTCLVLVSTPVFAQEAPPSAGAELQANVQNTLGSLTLQNMQCNAGLNELRRQVATLQAELDKAKSAAAQAPGAGSVQPVPATPHVPATAPSAPQAPK